MAGKKKAVASPEPVEEAAEVAAEPVKAPAKNAMSVSVFKDGVFIRTYSEEVHGENFRELAEEFASKVPGREVGA